MTEDKPLRVWFDDQSTIFRLGMVACLRAPAFVVVGESAGFSPAPEVDRFDLLVFELNPTALGEAIRMVRRAEAGPRLVAIAPKDAGDLVVEAVEAGVAGVLLRGDVTPSALARCLRTVASGNGSIPAAALPRIVTGSSRGRGAIGDLTGRELDVLRLLSQGGNTREIAVDLSYSEKTVKNIVHDVLVRMNCRNRAEAVALATRRGLI